MPCMKMWHEDVRRVIPNLIGNLCGEGSGVDEKLTHPGK